MDKALPEPEKNLEFEASDNKEYKIKTIIDSVVYDQQVNNSYQMWSLYHFVLWKGYLKEKNIWEPSLIVIYLRKLISTFHKEHLVNPIVIFLPLDFAPPIARLLVPKEPKQKSSRLSKGANKRSKN